MESNLKSKLIFCAVFRQKHAVLLSACFIMGIAAMAGRAQPAPAPITQRDINVMAASVEDARTALIDNARLRQPGEDLNAYLRRIALPLGGENPANYKTRITRYLDLIAHSVEATQTRRRLPALRDTNPANRVVWTNITHVLQLLPARVAHTQSAWESAQHVSRTNTKVSISPNIKASRFDAELAQTVSLLIALDDELRDARP